MKKNMMRNSLILVGLASLVNLSVASGGCKEQTSAWYTCPLGTRLPTSDYHKIDSANIYQCVKGEGGCVQGPTYECDIKGSAGRWQHATPNYFECTRESSHTKVSEKPAD